MVVFVSGDRSRATCGRLWQAIPEYYKKVTCYSDFWEAYKVIPEEQHEATGKEEDEKLVTSSVGSTL